MEAKIMGISPKGRDMNSVALNEARGLVASLIGSQPPGAKLKSAWGRVARVVGFTERRVRAIWNNEVRCLRADELEALRLAVANKRAPALPELAEQAARLMASASSLEAIDADFYRAEIDRLRDMACRLGHLDYPNGSRS